MAKYMNIYSSISLFITLTTLLAIPVTIAIMPMIIRSEFQMRMLCHRPKSGYITQILINAGKVIARHDIDTAPMNEMIIPIFWYATEIRTAKKRNL